MRERIGPAEGTTFKDMPDPRKGPVHVHIEQRARDCDGRLDRSWITPHGLLSTMEIYGKGDQITVTRHDDGTVYIYQDTDEGFVAYDLTECEDAECDIEKHTQRDYTAESMGY